MTKRATASVLWVVVASAVVLGCGRSGEPAAGNPPGFGSPGPETESTEAGKDPFDFSSPQLASPDSPEGAAQQFAQLMALGDTHIACGSAIEAPLRALLDRRGGCGLFLTEIAADEDYNYHNEACVNDPDNFHLMGDPADTDDSLRVDIRCPEEGGYTWVRVDRDGDTWRVGDINNNSSW